MWNCIDGGVFFVLSSERFWFLKKKRAQGSPSAGSSLDVSRRHSNDLPGGVRHVSPSPTHLTPRLKEVTEGPERSLPINKLRKAHKSTGM